MSSDHSVSSAAPELDDVARISRRLDWLAWLGAGIGVVVVLLYGFTFFGPLDKRVEAWGLFGDYVGGVLNPVFGFLSLIALLSTIAIQSRELSLSSRELRNSAAALEAQNATLRRQSFEETFFQLLRLHNDIVTAMDIGQVRGRDCIRKLMTNLRSQLVAQNALTDYDRMRVSYEAFFNQYQHEIGHYFRLLYNIVKLVHNAAPGDKRLYTNMVRAQLSSNELQLIFFNGLSRWGEAKFKPLIEEYGLLKSLPEDFPSAQLRAKYEPGAFTGPTKGGPAA